MEDRNWKFSMDLRLHQASISDLTYILHQKEQNLEKSKSVSHLN